MSNSSTSNLPRSSQSQASTTSTVVAGSGVPDSSQTAVDELTIILSDDDDDDDDMVNNLVKQMASTTLYTIGPTTTTPYWSTAGTAQCNGSPVRAVGTRPKPRVVARAWAVFIGITPGVYTGWPAAENQTKGESGTVMLGYRSAAHAQSAFAYAQSKNWVASTRDVDHPLIHKPAFRIDFTPPTVHKISQGSPLSVGACRSAWYIVFKGVEPGVYDNFLQAAINVSGIAGTLHESANTRQEAVRLYMRALGRKEIGTCVPI